MIRLLAKSVREYKLTSILSAFSMVFEIFFEVTVPLILADIIDSGINKGDMGYILRTGALVSGITLGALTLGALSGRFAAYASSGFAKNLRQDIFYRVQGFSFANIDRFSTPGLITRLTTDVTNVQNAYMAIIRHLVRCPVMFVAALAMTFRVNARLALIFLFIAPFLAAGLLLIIKFAHPLFVRVFDKYDSLNTGVQENLRGIRVVKSFVREEYETEKFKKRSADIRNDFVSAEKLVALNGPLMQISVYAAILLISWIGAHLVLSDELTTGQLMTVFTYAMQILMALMMMSMVAVIILISYASARRISEVLREESTLGNGEDPIYEVPHGGITFENVSFSYGGGEDNLCLKNIDLEIRPGETVGVIGGTGSAKSSLVHLIPRLYDTTAGAVTVGGHDVRRYDLETLRAAVAVVLQKNVLFSGTIRENLRWGDENATDDEMVRVCKLAQAHDFIMEMENGYDTYIEQGGSNVSGGQKQRLCIARALLKRPKVLILDDSTSAVDTKTDALIRKAFREELPGTTKLIIAQRISSVQDADKIVIMDAGKVSAFGSHDELLKTSEIYRELYESQNKGGVGE